jgi:hypothetical protein
MGRRTKDSEPSLVRVSAALTSRGGLLPVAVAASEASPINATHVSRRTGISVGAASRELRLLEQIGLLREAETDRATIDFEVVDPKAWLALLRLCERAEDGALEPL